jgi:hypothetical protein
VKTLFGQRREPSLTDVKSRETEWP